LARSGSKGLPDKNIRPLCGKPMMAWTIEAAIKSNCFDSVVVSTDSEEYAEIARSYGAEVPFLRSKESASDTAPSYIAINEVINRYKNELGKSFDNHCLLQPTSPLRDANDIIGAYELYKKNNAIKVISVCECDHLPTLSGTLNEKCELYGFIPDGTETRRNFAPKYYRINGAIYITDIEADKHGMGLCPKNGYAYIMDRVNSVDVDTIDDFEYAEFLLNKKIQNK